MRALRTIARLPIAVVAFGFVLFTLTSAPQTLSPGEVRISSRPYQPRPSLVRSQSRLVQIEVVVRDSRGHAVPGLTKDNFAIYDSGKNRDLTTFSIETSNTPVINPSKSASVPPGKTLPSVAMPPKLPNQTLAGGRWIGLLFDDINTLPGDLAHAKIAAARFIKEATTGGSHIAVFTTSGDEMSEFTTDSSAVLATVARLQSHPRISPGGLMPCPRITAYEAYQIVNKDPSAMQAKVEEACQCSGGSQCDASAIPATELSNPASKYSGGAYGGSGALSTAIDTVRAQAQQTWDQVRLVSEATLNGIRASLDHLAQMPGKRILLLASSGFLSGMLDQEQDAIIDDALRAGVVINSLDAKGLYAEAPGGNLNESVEVIELPVSTELFQVRSLGDRLDSVDSAMARFAESTGGLFFRNNNDLDLGFYRLGLVPAYTYLLGFPPAEDGKYHKIKVELKNASRDFIQARPGYFAPTKASSEPTAEEKLDAEMRGSDERTDFPVVISEKLAVVGAKLRQLTIDARVDIQKLPFQRQKDRHVQKLTFVAALFNYQGNFVIGKEAEMDLALKPESFERFSKSGIGGAMSLEAPPGAYRLRVVAQEALHGSMNATSKSVEIP